MRSSFRRPYPPCVRSLCSESPQVGMADDEEPCLCHVASSYDRDTRGCKNGGACNGFAVSAAFGARSLVPTWLSRSRLRVRLCPSGSGEFRSCDRSVCSMHAHKNPCVPMKEGTPTINNPQQQLAGEPHLGTACNSFPQGPQSDQPAVESCSCVHAICLTHLITICFHLQCRPCDS